VPGIHRSLQSPCTIVVKDYKLLPNNNMKAADSADYPFLCSLRTSYVHPIGEEAGADPQYQFASCFPVAPNILLTASHAVYDDRFFSAGYKISQIESRQLQFYSQREEKEDSQRALCTLIPNASKKEVVEKDPITGDEWILPRDYAFLHVIEPVHYYPKFLIPKVARVGDSIVFPARRPNIARDVSLVDDVKFALILAFQYGGLSEAEARKKASDMNIDLKVLQQLLGSEVMIQGKGKVLKVADGLIAHDSHFFRGMSGTFGSVAPGTFSCVGISSGTGAISPGTNYNVAVDINREDFKEDYAKIVLPNLPRDVQLSVEKFLK